MEMSKIDANKLPAVLTDDLIELIIPMVQAQTKEWHELADKLSAEQRSQIYGVIENRNREKANAWLQTATQAEKDALYRWGAIHMARDHWFVTIFDEYDLVNGTGYYPNISLDLIKESSPIGEAYELVKLRRSYMQPNEKFTFFEAGYEFSTYYPANFSLHGLLFPTVFHYVVYKKAEQFLDRELMDAILKTTSTMELMKLSYKVKYFEKIVWNMVLKPILYNGFKAVFQQNESMMKQLAATKGTTLVLAEADDAKWGCGFKKDDPRINDRKAWPGKNLLGELLTEIRVSLLGGY
jgi:ribA/ribD-fused uncharacterized protein